MRTDALCNCSQKPCFAHRWKTAETRMVDTFVGISESGKRGEVDIKMHTMSALVNFLCSI